jgi:hypothetical protein
MVFKELLIMDYSFRLVTIGRSSNSRLSQVATMILLSKTSKFVGQTISFNFSLVTSARGLSYSRIR